MKINYANTIMGLGIVGIFISPALFTLDSCCELFDFTETGQIGDTIGGITAPIVGLVSIILLYFTLKMQIDFNKEQKIDNMVSHILMIQSDLNTIAGRVKYDYYIDDQPREGTGLITLGKLSATNAQISFDYLELNALFRECKIAISLCRQIRELAKKLEANNVYRNIFYTYTTDFYKVICSFFRICERKIVHGSALDAYGPNGESEIDNLLKEIHTEREILKNELNQI